VYVSWNSSLPLIFWYPPVEDDPGVRENRDEYGDGSEKDHSFGNAMVTKK